MKKVFLIILIAFLCVIGALGLGIGGMYLFGGFNEKIVYASELHFNQTEKVSAESIYLQIDTTTEGVTRKTLKLNAINGGERIINFPPTVNIGETFRVIPRQENGVNVGGNVTLVAMYESSDANVGVQARCNILIDIPIESATVNLSTKKLKPDQIITICEKGKKVTDAINIEPLNSLVPYKKSGEINETIKETLIDKVMKLELVSAGEVPIEKVASLIDDKGVKYSDDLVEIEYEYNENKELVFANTIRLKAGSDTCDVKLNLYTYSTYKDQSKDISGIDIVLNKDHTISNTTGFSVGSYVIDKISILGNEDDNRTMEKDVLLNKEIKIYVKNDKASPNDINLDMKLTATESQSATIGNFEYLNNVYLRITDDEFLTLTRSDGSTADVGSVHGLNLNCEGLSDQISTWYWVLKINNFQAYYRYMTEQKKLVATLEYFLDDTSKNPTKEFNIIPTINEVESLTPKYPAGETSFRIKSGEALNLGPNNITINSVGATNPTFKDIVFYIDYSENSVNSATTISTIPTQVGDYKATFNFTLNQKLEQSQLNNLQISCDSWATIDREKCVFNFLYNSGNIYTYSAEVYITRGTDNPPQDTLFNITLDDRVTPITPYVVKFYEQLENSTNFQSIPYLSIGGIRYYIDFDFVQDGTNRYLKINNETFFDNAYTISGIGSLVITAQLVYIERDGNEDTIYWLTRRTEDSSNPTLIRTLIHIDVYEELSTLYASSYDIDSDEYDIAFTSDNTVYSEDEEKNVHYIFITSNEIEALKNYISYNQVKVSFKPYFTGFDASLFKGIEEINSDAITFGSNFTEVRKNNVVVGYRISYTINSVDSIEINNAFIDNIFRIEISIEVNGNPVFAEFKMDTSSNNFLDVKIEDKIITKAELSYNTTGNNGTTEERAIELRGGISNGIFTYGDWENSLRYCFKYNKGDEGIIDSMSYGLRIVDDNSNINLNNLYTCNLNYYDDIKTGRGGLKFNNFPVVYDDEGNSKGVLVEFRIFSMENDLSFNTHYYYDRENNRFLKKLNDNLSAKLYFRIFGMEISIEAKNDINFIGFKGNELNVFGNADDTESVFNITVKDGNGVEVEVSDYSQIFTAVLGSRFVSFKDKDYTQIVVDRDVLTKDFNTRETISFSFHIGSTSEANQIKIKRTEDTSVTTYYLNVMPAFKAELVAYENGYVSPSGNSEDGIKVVNVTYNKDNSEVTKDLANVSVQIVRESLPKFDGITDDVVKVNEDNTLVFMTVPSSYTFKIKLIITKTYIDENENETSANCEHFFDIFVTPTFKEEDLTIGSFHAKENDKDKDYWFITAGTDGYANYEGALKLEKGNITDIDVTFEDVVTDNQVSANQHMTYTFDAVSSNLKIISRNLNYDKDVKLFITMTFADGGKFVYEKTIKVLGNMTLDFKPANKQLNISAQNNNLNLIDDIYNFTINDVDNNKKFSEEVIAEFIYSNPNGTYKKESFVFDNTIFQDMTPEGRKEHEYFYLRVRYESLEKDRKYVTTIKFSYVVDNSYTLVFDLELIINVIGNVKLEVADGANVININSKSEPINLIDASLYNFTINEQNQNERFKTEILDAFDYNNLEAQYNKNTFYGYDTEIFEDVTVPKTDSETGGDGTVESGTTEGTGGTTESDSGEETTKPAEKINKFLLKVKYDESKKGTTDNVIIKFNYVSATGTIEFVLRFTINYL